MEAHLAPTAIVDAEARERIAEIAEILAAGLIRLRGRKSSQIAAGAGDSSLDCLAHQSGDANHVLQAERAA